MISKTSAVAIAVFATLSFAPEAKACSGIWCSESEFFPARGTVPANLPAVLYWPTSWGGETRATGGGPDGGAEVGADGRADGGADGGATSYALDSLRFVRLDPAGPVDVPFHAEVSTERSTGNSSNEPAFRIIPDSELQAGERYALWSGDCDGNIATEAPQAPPALTNGSTPMPWNGPYAVFDVSEAAPIPTSIDNLVLGAWAGRLMTLWHGASCSYEATVNVMDVSVDLTENVWADALAFRTFVDDEWYRISASERDGAAYGHSWTGHGADTLVGGCSASSVGAADHTVRMEAVVAGTDQVLTTQSAEFSFYCDDGQDAGTDSGSPRADSGAADPGAADPGIADSGTAEDSGASTGSSLRASGVSNGSSSCSASPQPASSGPWALLSLLGLSLLRRRKP